MKSVRIRLIRVLYRQMTVQSIFIEGEGVLMQFRQAGIVWICTLLFLGCGAARESESPRGARMSVSGNPYFEQGNIYLKQKQYHKAIEQYQQALRLNPDEAIIYAALGWAYYNVGNLDAAIAAGEEVMRLEPNHPDVPKLMELLYQERERRRGY